MTLVIEPIQQPCGAMVTGWLPALPFNSMLTRYIKGMSAEDSHSVLQRMYKLFIDKTNIYGHEWQAGDLVRWEIIGQIHRRDGFYPHATRSMRQLTTLSSHS